MIADLCLKFAVDSNSQSLSLIADKLNISQTGLGIVIILFSECESTAPLDGSSRNLHAARDDEQL